MLKRRLSCVMSIKKLVVPVLLQSMTLENFFTQPWDIVNFKVRSRDLFSETYSTVLKYLMTESYEMTPCTTQLTWSSKWDCKISEKKRAVRRLTQGKLLSMAKTTHVELNWHYQYLTMIQRVSLVLVLFFGLDLQYFPAMTPSRSENQCSP